MRNLRAHSSRPVALAIAGSDPSGGAGIQADLRVFAAFGVHGFSALTAVIAQNSADVRRVAPVAASLVAAQIETVVAERIPDAVKTGALANAAIVRAVARTIRRLGLPAPVVDPVMIASSGRRLLDRAGVRALRDQLLPLASVVTPNLPEAEALCGMRIHDANTMRSAARLLRGLGAQAVLIKGGHFARARDSVDLFFDGRRFVELRARRLAGGAHGTGCAFASAIAARLAQGATLERAVRDAKRFVSRALARRFRLSARGAPMLVFAGRR
jgi:hydroxymethylpyrimidine/phosphomethylpyrimidine kinase